MKSAYLSTLGFLAAVVTIVALSTLVLPGWSGGVNADDDNRTLQFRARLSGGEEVTTPPGGVSTETEGSARFKFNNALTELEFALEVEDGVRVTQAHIHCGAAGTNGPIIIFLGGLHANGWDIDGKWVGNATATDANITDATCGTTLAQIAESMKQGLTYANVHTIANPAGEVRGQITQSGGGGD